MKKWNVPLTYEPKIPKVISGECTQTIRTGRKYRVGDLIRFYTWEGRPYHSKRRTITPYFEIDQIMDMRIFNDIVWIENPNIKQIVLFGKLYKKGDWHPWRDLNWLANLDGINPPTGEELGKVLMSKNKIPASGIEAQIVRWRFEK